MVLIRLEYHTICTSFELMIGVDSRFGVKHGVFLVDFFELCLLTGGVEAGE